MKWIRWSAGWIAERFMRTGVKWVRWAGIWLLVGAIYWSVGAWLWPVVAGVFRSDSSPEVWQDDDLGIACIAWHDQVACQPIPVVAPLNWIGPSE